VAREVLEDPRLKEIWGRISLSLPLTPFSAFTHGGGPLGLTKVDCVITIRTNVQEPQSAMPDLKISEGIGINQ